MITIDEWYKSKLSLLRAKGEERDINKRAPLEAFVMLVKTELRGKLMDSKAWGKLYEKYTKTGRIR